MKTMINKISDFVFPVTGGSAGGVFGVITFGEMANTAITAAIFAVVGAILGFYVHKLLKWIHK